MAGRQYTLVLQHSSIGFKVIEIKILLKDLNKFFVLLNIRYFFY